MEFIWQDISGFLTSILGIFIYGSLLSLLNPLLLVIIAVVSLTSYFTTRLQPKYYEKHKDEPEFKKKNKENNRRWLSNPANLERKRAMDREYSRKRYAARKEAEMKIDLGKE